MKKIIIIFAILVLALADPTPSPTPVSSVNLEHCSDSYSLFSSVYEFYVTGTFRKGSNMTVNIKAVIADTVVISRIDMIYGRYMINQKYFYPPKVFEAGYVQEKGLDIKLEEDWVGRVGAKIYLYHHDEFVACLYMGDRRKMNDHRVEDNVILE